MTVSGNAIGRRPIVAGALVAGTMLATGIAGPAPAPAQETLDGSGVTIGVAMRTQTQPRWAFDVASMEQRAEELGAELRVQWANDDPIRQSSQVENLLSQGVDALILVPVDDRAASTLVAKAAESDVPTLAYDIAIPDADVAFFLTRDNREVGRLQVQGALDFAPPNADDPPGYVLIKGDPDNNVARELAAVYEEMLTPLAEAGEIEIVADQWHENWSGQSALETAENALAANDDDVQAFVTSNDGMAIGVVQALQGRDMAGEAYVSGLDADVPNDRLIVEGVIDRSVWTMIDEMGARAVEAAVALATGVEPEADGMTNNGFGDIPSAFIEVVPVTADTMCQWIREVAPEGWVTVEDVYVNVDPPADCAG
ncbi:MAG: substrate-binding domain-containing protein [Azospirillaceae bacterium]